MEVPVPRVEDVPDAEPVRRDDLLWCVCELLRPRAEPDAPLPAERGPVEEGEPTLLELSVLVAEDNPVNQRIITRFLDKLNVRWSVENDQRTLLRVGSKADCQDNAWFYDDALFPTRVIACDQTCEEIKASEDSSIDLLLGCATIVPG